MQNPPDNHDDLESFNGLTRDQWAQMKADRDWEGIFGSIGRDWTVHIDRVRPTWCDGWCETIHQDPEEPIDLEYIRDQWGGKKFKLRIKDENSRYVATVHVKIDAEPKRYGKRIPHPDELEHERRRETRELELEARRSTPQSTQAPAIDPTIGKLLVESIKTSGAGKDAQIDFLTEMLKEHFGRPQEKPRDLAELLELAKSMREMLPMFGVNLDNAGDQDWIGSNLGRFLDIMDRHNSIEERRGGPRGDRRRDQRDDRRGPVRIVKNLGSGNDTATRGLDRSPARGAQTAAGGGIVAAPHGDDSPLSRTQLAATLAAMQPIDSVAVVMGALHEMGPDKRRKVISMMMDEDPGELDGDDQVDDELDELDGDDQVDDEPSEAAS